MCAGVSSGGRFRRVQARAGVGSGGRLRKVAGSFGVCWCRFRKVLEGCRFRRVTVWLVALQPCQGQPCDCFEYLLVITLSAWAEPLRKKMALM